MDQPVQQSGTIESADTPAEVAPTPAPADADLFERESLVEEVSIDGMCGVY